MKSPSITMRVMVPETQTMGKITWRSLDKGILDNEEVIGEMSAMQTNNHLPYNQLQQRKLSQDMT